MQAAKFIDVTRTFLPIKASTFPTTMHGTAKEDSPETRIPVMAYEAKNILPTSMGYMSYFGTVSQLEIDALPANADYLFIYQNDLFENILIALCDSGIWIKKGNATGAWTQAHTVVLDADPNAHYPWTYSVLNDDLYCYQQNKPNYQKIVSAVGPGVTVTSFVPNTLNMTAQMGIFRAGGRLGFWDSDDSIAWSSLDNYQDFVTSIQTQAGATKFSDIYGRIVTIKGMGPGFIVYATKSIVYIAPNFSSSFRWQPSVIFSNNGIVYPKNVIQASPDTTHYCYTRQGIFRIENAKEELILPEFFDTLQKHQGPVYLNLLEGRYLCFEILEPDFMEGLTNFSEGTAEPITYYFPGIELDIGDAIADELLQGTNMCKTLEGLNQGVYGPQPTFPDKKEGTLARPKYEAHLSAGGVMGEVTAWTNTPVATIDPNGIEVNMCPATGEAGKTSQLSTGDTGKRIVAGEDAYIDDSGWTMERFVQAQTAIWKLEEKAREAFFNQVLARQFTRTSNAPAWNNLPYAESNTLDKQLIGRYAGSFTPPVFGYSTCEFWLTRVCVSAKDIYRNKRTVIKNTDTLGAAQMRGYASYWDFWTGGPIVLAAAVSTGSVNSKAEAIRASLPNQPATIESINVFAPGDAYSGPSNYSDLDRGCYQLYADVICRDSSNTAISTYLFEVWIPTAGNMTTISTPNPALPVNKIEQRHVNGRYQQDTVMVATNSAQDVAIAPIFDSGFCTLTGWEYTKNDDTQGIIFMPDCDSPAAFPEDSKPREATPNVGATVGKDGSFCSHPFEPVIIPGADYSPVNWPPTSINLPANFFLLQDGSIAPKYPTFYGMFPYDLHLKKWGKMDSQYKLLLNYSPINSAFNGLIAFEDFGIKSGILDGGGKIRIFDAYPEESYITYGKLGYYRRGFSSQEEITVHFSEPSTGFLSVTPSLEGKFPNNSLAKTVGFSDADMVTLLGGNPGRWHNVTISGHYNFNYVQYQAQPMKGNR